MRIVWEVREASTAAIYKTLLFRFHDFARADLGSVAHGYVPKRSIVTNAAQHVGARLVMNADIRSFFPTITRDRLLGFLGRAGPPPRTPAVPRGAPGACNCP